MVKRKAKKEIKREIVKEPVNEIIDEGTNLALNTPYISEDNGMTVTMKNIETVEHDGFNEYTITNEEKNNTSDEVITPGSFKIYYTNGEYEPQYGMFNDLYPGESKIYTYTFKALKIQEALLVEYADDGFFNVEPSENTLKWYIN